MPISKGLQESLNLIRETSIKNDTLYHKQINEITPESDISILSPLLDNQDLMNEFFNALIKRIVYTRIDTKLFNDPLAFLDGSEIPLGYMGQEIHINPAKGRRFDANDFAGLLAKYEADIKVQYPHVNSDIQYPVSIPRAKLKNAFVSWANLQEMIDGLTQSLYNGARIDRYNFKKGLVAQAYNKNHAIVKAIDGAITDKAKAEKFLTMARTMFLDFQDPTSDFNAWKQVGGYGKDIVTWTDAEDIVFLIRNDIGAYLDVNVLSQAFNIDKAKLLGKVKYVKDFSERDSEGNVVVDGSKIVGIMADKRWFKIKNQETTVEDSYNANNRTMQVYLNDVNMFQYSLFANAVIFATELPKVDATGIEFVEKDANIKAKEERIIHVSLTPAPATTEVTFTSTQPSKATVTKIDNRSCKVVGVTDGAFQVKAQVGDISKNLDGNVTSMK